jgi:hypothetical protein
MLPDSAAIPGSMSSLSSTADVSPPVDGGRTEPAGYSQAAIPRLFALRMIGRRHFSPFKTYLRSDRGVAVFLNPKVGSTMFRNVLLDALNRAGALPLLGPRWPIRPIRRMLTAPATDFLHAALYPDRYACYAFVRNPYTRLLSAWRDKFSRAHDAAHPPRALARTLPAVRRFASRRSLPLEDAAAHVPFATFVAFVESQTEGRRDHHWDTQRSVLFTDLVAYRRTFKLETEFAAGVEEILTRLELPTAGVSEKLARPLNASRQLTQPAFDAELAERVYRIYAGDFEQFGYERDSWQGL